ESTTDHTDADGIHYIPPIRIILVPKLCLGTHFTKLRFVRAALAQLGCGRETEFPEKRSQTEFGNEGRGKVNVVVLSRPDPESGNDPHSPSERLPDIASTDPAR